MKDFRKDNKPKLYGWYTIWSAGVTLFLVFVAAIIDSAEIGPEEHRPNIGSESCLLHSKEKKFSFLK